MWSQWPTLDQWSPTLGPPRTSFSFFTAAILYKLFCFSYNLTWNCKTGFSFLGLAQKHTRVLNHFGAFADTKVVQIIKPARLLLGLDQEALADVDRDLGPHGLHAVHYLLLVADQRHTKLNQLGQAEARNLVMDCLLYTSDAADE